MLELGHKEGWVPMNWCFQIMVLEKTLESPLDCKEIKPVNPKGNQPRIFVVRTDAEAEAPVFGPPDANSRLIGKDPDIGKDWRQKEKRATEDKMNHWCNGHELGQIPGDGEGQGGLEWCSPWDRKELGSWTTTTTPFINATHVPSFSQLFPISLCNARGPWHRYSYTHPSKIQCKRSFPSKIRGPRRPNRKRAERSSLHSTHCFYFFLCSFRSDHPTFLRARDSTPS